MGDGRVTEVEKRVGLHYNSDGTKRFQETKKMQVVRALYDGRDIRPMEPIKAKKQTEVLVIFPNKEEGMNPETARKLLRGSGRGEKLTEKLLKTRADDKVKNGAK